MSAHTPGPWKLDGLTIYALAEVPGIWMNGRAVAGNIFSALVQPDSRVCSPEEAEANARVMCAAPELLEACRYMRKLLVDMGHDVLAGAILGESAIAKAEGR